MSKKVAVIGAGIGGLSAAIDLKSRGFEVDLYEKNNYTGGKAGYNEFDGFTFDTGPSLLTMPFVFEKLFTKAGKKMTDYIPVKKLDIICRYFFSDGTIFNAFSDKDRLLNEFQEKTSEDRQALVDFFEYCKKMYDFAKDIFLFESLEKVPAIFKEDPLRGLRIITSLDIFRTLHSSHKKAFKDPNIVQLFDRYATYSGSDPFKLPATLNIIPHVEYGLGAYYPEEGIRAIPRSLTKIAIEEGVRIFKNTKIEKILHDGKKVTGLGANSWKKDYDILVSNSDVSATYKDLLKGGFSRMAKRYLKAEPSSSAIVFYWGIKETFKELEINNIFFSKDYKKEFTEIFDKKICPGEPTIYINITSKYCPQDAPKGSESWFVLVNVPYDQGQDWQAEVNKARKSIFNTLKTRLGKDIESKIVSERVMTPSDIYQNTLSNKGSIYGISSNKKMAAFYRQPNRCKELKGLYFSGGSAHPGGGMPLVALSGMIASSLVEEYET